MGGLACNLIWYVKMHFFDDFGADRDKSKINFDRNNGEINNVLMMLDKIMEGWNLNQNLNEDCK